MTLSKPAASRIATASTVARDKTAEIAPRRHRADKNIFIQPERGHPDAVAKDRSAGKRTRRIDADDPHLFAFVFVMKSEFIDERRFSRTRVNQ